MIDGSYNMNFVMVSTNAAHETLSSVNINIGIKMKMVVPAFFN